MQTDRQTETQTECLDLAGVTARGLKLMRQLAIKPLLSTAQTRPQGIAARYNTEDTAYTTCDVEVCSKQIR